MASRKNSRLLQPLNGGADQGTVFCGSAFDSGMSLKRALRFRASIILNAILHVYWARSWRVPIERALPAPAKVARSDFS